MMADVSPSPMRHSLIIFNPASGTGDPEKRKAQILTEVKKYDWKGEIIETTLTHTAQEIVSSAIKKGTRSFIVSGGDGTIMEVIGEVIGRKCILGIIPQGTGNLFALNLSISLVLEENVRVLFTGTQKHIDIGRANETYFSIIAGVGLDADMMRKADRRLKNKLGVMAYILSGIKSIHKHSGLYKVVIDDHREQIVKAKSIMVANMGKISGGVTLVPKADPESGTLRIGVIKASTLLDWLSLLVNSVRGQIHKSPRYTLLEGTNVLITSLRGPVHYECDGNHFPPTSVLKVQISPKALAVMVED